MTDKSLKVYIGDDRLPVQDLTDYVDWPDSRFIGQAYNGESSVSSVVFRDENAQFGPWVDSPVTIAVRNEVEVLHGSNFLYRGRWIGRTWERGVQKAYQAREVTAEAEDVNVELRGLIVDGWVRPSETYRARVLALREDYLDGSVRAGTNLATTYVSSSNTHVLPAKTYERTDPLGVLQDVAFQTHKQFFVTIDKELFYDGWDSSAYACSFRITDDEAELRTSPTTTLGIIPDSGPLFAINGQRFIDGIRLYYGAGSTDYVDVTHPGLSSAKAHWRETVYAPESIKTATEAANLAETILQERSQDGRTFMLSVCHASGGPLTDAQVGSIKPGMLISIKARVLPFFFTNGQPNYAYYSTRIVSLQWHMPLPGQYFATLKLEHPERTYGIGVPPGPRPAGPGTAPTFILSDSNAEGATGTPTLTVPSGLTDAALFIAVGNVLPQTFPPGVTWNGATGVLYNSVNHGTQGGIALYYILDPPVGGAFIDSGNANGYVGAWLYEGVNQTTPIASWSTATGTSAAAAASMTAVSGAMPIAAMTVDDDDFVDDGQGTGPVAVSGMTADWSFSLQAGTPGFRDMQYAGGHDDWSAGWTLNHTHPWTAFVAAVNGTGGSVPEDVGTGGDTGTDTGTYANADHVHAHGTHATGDYHPEYVPDSLLTTAGDVPYATGASTWTRLPIGASNFHLNSDGVRPVWMPQTAGGSGMTNPMTTAGDIIKGGVSGTPERLAIGGSNFVLKSTGSTPEWSNTLRLSYIDLDEHTLGLPPSPPAGAVRLYGSNSKAFYENSSGTVVELGGAGGGGGISGIAVEEDGSEEGATITRLNFTTNLDVSVTGSEATISATGGGGGATSDPERWDASEAPGSPEAQNDEFEDASIGGGLTRVYNSGTPKGSWAERYGALSFNQTVTTGTELDVYAQARTVSTGDYVEVAGRLGHQGGAGSTVAGIALGFSNGTTYGTSNALSVFWHSTGSSNRFMLNNWPGHNTRAGDGTIVDRGNTGDRWYVRVKYESSNTWGLYISFNGHQWYTIQSNYAYTMTPTHVIFGMAALAQAPPGWLIFDYFRVNPA
jgi:hypothetical protein